MRNSSKLFWLGIFTAVLIPFMPTKDFAITAVLLAVVLFLASAFKLMLESEE